MYLGKYEERRGVKGRERVVPVGRFKLARRGAYRRPYSVRENYNSLFRAHPLRQDDSRLERSNHAGGFSHALMRNYRCRDYGEGRARVYCFAVEHADARGQRRDFLRCERISDFYVRELSEMYIGELFIVCNLKSDIKCLINRNNFHYFNSEQKKN